jgi:metal-sulfur cluster biosynthetic enzyme|tara:strand:- start:2316 stop:2603 length:288 start_codon:yes stop_codon:yes gene_type:complete
VAISESDCVEVFQNYVDPELGIDVWTLGLIYECKVQNNEDVNLKMTFTTPLCPFGPQMVSEIEQELKQKGAVNVSIEVVFEPRWEPSEEVKELLL